MLETNAADLLADALAQELFFGEVPSICVPVLALAVISCAPTLRAATEAQTQYIFDALVGALAAKIVARHEAQTARWRN